MSANWQQAAAWTCHTQYTKQMSINAMYKKVIHVEQEPLSSDPQPWQLQRHMNEHLTRMKE